MTRDAILNAALLLLYPVAWAAPLMEARVMWIFGGEGVSILSGVVKLWSSDAALAVLVALLAIVFPYAKVVATQALLMGRLPEGWGRALPVIARLSFADIFLVALYVVVAKGMTGASVEPRWGLWLFTACVGASLWLSWRKP